MAPIPSDDESIASGSSASDSEAQHGQANGFAGLEDGEEEFHTEDSDASEEDIGADAEVGERSDEESDAESDENTNAPAVPLLPDHLLKPTTKQPAPIPASIPWDQLTRPQKRARRNNSRKMKKRSYDRLAAGVKGTATLDAGKVAQVKRGVVSVGKRDGVRSGRVEKKRSGKGEEGKVKVSGLQRLVEGRKREVGVAGRNGSGKGGRKARSKR